MRLARASLFITALVFGGFGIALLVMPSLMEVVQVRIVGPEGAVEIRAFYGGLELGLACFFATAAMRADWLRPGLFLQIAALGGVVLGRVVGLVVDAEVGAQIYFFMSLEAAGAMFGAVALRTLDRETLRRTARGGATA